MFVPGSHEMCLLSLPCLGTGSLLCPFITLHGEEFGGMSCLGSQHEEMLFGHNIAHLCCATLCDSEFVDAEEHAIDDHLCRCLLHEFEDIQGMMPTKNVFDEVEEVIADNYGVVSVGMPEVLIVDRVEGFKENPHHFYAGSFVQIVLLFDLILCYHEDSMNNGIIFSFDFVTITGKWFEVE